MSEILGLPDWLGKPFAVFLIDILLAGDNAIVIALVAASLPPGGRVWVLVFGTAGAIALRVLLAILAGTVLALPGLKIAGGVLLAFLALNLAVPEERAPADAPVAGRVDVMVAALLVVFVDVLMSLDNVLALAAVAGDSWLYLFGGLLLSVSIVMFGAALVAGLVARLPALARIGAALLGWTAGQMLTTDALDAGWIAQQAPALPLLVPALAALFVYLIAQPAAPRAVAPRPIAVPVAPRPREADSEGDPADRVAFIMFVVLFIGIGCVLTFFAFIAGGPMR